MGLRCQLYLFLHIILRVLLLLLASSRDMSLIGLFSWPGIDMGMRLSLRAIAIECACHGADKGSQIIGNRLHTLKEVGVDLGSEHENNGKVVEEDRKSVV